jgi:hypothetical protein
MIKYLAIPLILVGCTAPVTDPPAHACSPRLDGKPTYCPPPDGGPMVPKPKPKVFLPRESAQGEIDIWNPHHFIHMEQMFIRNARRNEIEKNMTQPEDAINKALMEFNNGDRN